MEILIRAAVAFVEACLMALCGRVHLGNIIAFLGMSWIYVLEATRSLTTPSPMLNWWRKSTRSIGWFHWKPWCPESELWGLQSFRDSVYTFSGSIR